MEMVRDLHAAFRFEEDTLLGRKIVWIGHSESIEEHYMYCNLIDMEKAGLIHFANISDTPQCPFQVDVVQYPIVKVTAEFVYAQSPLPEPQGY